MAVTYIPFCQKCAGTPGGTFRKVSWGGVQALLCEACAAEVEQQAVVDQAPKKKCCGNCDTCKNPAHVR